MIRWCSFCQDFLGERAPYDDVNISHGICLSCAERLEKGAPLKQETEQVRALSRKIFEKARAGDESACAAALAEAEAAGLSRGSILIGLLQPALYRAGHEWHAGRMSVTEEHRLTSWCERVFAMIPPAPRKGAPIDLLILQPPGNVHTLGPRFAREALAAWGLSVEVVMPELPLEEVVALVRHWRPRVVGLSCALASQVPVTVAFITQLRARLGPSAGCRYLLSGFAFRLGGSVEVPRLGEDIDVAVDLPSARQFLTGS